MVINTGTWLKQFERVSPRFGLLPQVYVPSFRLNYFRVCGDGGRIAVEYETIEKTPGKELTLLQRLLTRRKRRSPPESIPARTLVAPAPR